MRLRVFLWALVVGVIVALPAYGVTVRVESHDCDWQSTGLSVNCGDTMEFSASGSVRHILLPTEEYCGPEGNPGICDGNDRCCLAPALGNNALVGKIGPGGRPFHIGEGATITAAESGTLLLGMNETARCAQYGSPPYYGCADNEGHWTVSVVITPNAEPCEYALSPTEMSFSSSAESVLVQVHTTSCCAWTATSPCTWATLSTEGRTGTGAVTVSVAANTGAARSCVLTIAGQLFAITQAGVSGVPVVRGVSPAYSCWFPRIPEWQSSIPYTVDVDWSGLTPTKLLVSVGGSPPSEYPGPGPILLGMADLAPYDDAIAVTAVGAHPDGVLVESAPFRLPFTPGSNAIWVVDLPSFVWAACPACAEGLKNLQSETGWRLASGEVALKIPSFSISIPQAIPIIGGTWTFGGKPTSASRKALIGYEVTATCSGLSLATGAGMEFSKSGGDWEFGIGGGVSLALQASFDPSIGFALSGGSGTFSLRGKVSKEFTVPDFVPALKALENVYILGDVIKSLKLEVAIAPSISATFPFVVDESASFFGLPIALDAEQGVSIDIGLGISAALKASLCGYVDAEARVTASAGWGFTLPDFVAGCLELSLDLDASFTLHGLWWEYTYSVPTVTVCSFSAGPCGSAWVPGGVGEGVAALWDRASVGDTFPNAGSSNLASGSSSWGTLFAGPRRTPTAHAVASFSPVAAETPPTQTAARPYDSPGFGESGIGRAPAVGESGVVDTLLMVKTYPAAFPAVCLGASSSFVAWTTDNVSMPLGAGTGTFFSRVGTDGLTSAPIEVLNGPAAETDPDVATAGPSTALLAWVRSAAVGSETNDLDPDFLSSLEIVYALSQDAGLTWQGPTELTRDASSDLAPKFVSDASVGLALVWVKKASASLVAEDEKKSSVWAALWNGAGFDVPALLADDDTASARAFLLHGGAVYYARITRAPGDEARSLVLTRHDLATSTAELLQRSAARTATSIALAELEGVPWLFWVDLPRETSTPTLYGSKADSDTEGVVSWVLPPLVISLNVVTAQGSEPVVILGRSAGSTTCDLYRGTLSMSADEGESEELALLRLTEGGAVRQPIDVEAGQDGIHVVYTTRIPGERAVELHHLLVP